MVEDTWKNKLFDHYDYIEKNSSKELIFGCFLHGSQNYNLADSDSDVDVNCFFIDPIHRHHHETICLQKKDRIIFSNASILLNKIRLQKLNIGYVEYLLTEYFIINPVFEKEWQEIRNISEEIIEIVLYLHCIKIIKKITIFYLSIHIEQKLLLIYVEKE